MWTHLFSIFVLLSTSLVCFADSNSAQPSLPLEPFTGTYLKILGRGVLNADTGDMVAITCTGEMIANAGEPSCKKVRYIIWKKDVNQTFYIGREKTVSTDSEPTLADLEAFTKQESVRVKNFRKTSNHEHAQKTRNHLLLSGFGVVGAIGFTLRTDSSGGLTPTSSKIILSSMATLALGGLLIAALNHYPMTTAGGYVSNAMANQNGWDWAVKPKPISGKKFQWLERYLNN